jgi:hypothetical protein
MPISRQDMLLIRSARRRGWTVERSGGSRYNAIDPGGVARVINVDNESDAWIEAGYENQKDIEGEEEHDVYLYRASENPLDVIDVGLIAVGISFVGLAGWLVYKTVTGSNPLAPSGPVAQNQLTPQQQADAADQVPPFVSGT